MASAMPDLRLPSQPQGWGITKLNSYLLTYLHHPLTSTNLYCLVTEARVWRACLGLLIEGEMARSCTCNIRAATAMP